ncbi:MAG: hypothetical protein H6R23_151 [Proteobacteria bacterium]|jgi:hypothetical protein|nr:hypothetical protein [Pseudomonadota bacterium]
MKIFLSAVSSQFKACRDALASDLRLEEYAACPGGVLNVDTDINKMLTIH